MMRFLRCIARGIIAVAALGLVIFIIDDLDEVTILARLAQTTDAAIIELLGYLVVGLTIGGAVLFVPRPKIAAALFAVGSPLAFFLGVSTIWENMIVWGVCLVLLALAGLWLRKPVRRQSDPAAIPA